MRASGSLCCQLVAARWLAAWWAYLRSTGATARVGYSSGLIECEEGQRRSVELSVDAKCCGERAAWRDLERSPCPGVAWLVGKCCEFFPWEGRMDAWPRPDSAHAWHAR